MSCPVVIMSVQNTPCHYCSNRTRQDTLTQLVSDVVPAAISGFTIAGPIGLANSVVATSLDYFFLGSSCPVCSGDGNITYNYSRYYLPFLTGLVTGSFKPESLMQLGHYAFKSGVRTSVYDIVLNSFIKQNQLRATKVQDIVYSTIISGLVSDQFIKFMAILK